MITVPNRITIFEHETIRVDRGEKLLTAQQLNALQVFHREKDFPFYSFVHNGVKFGSYVGVLQIGSTTIEILPKADKKNDDDTWRRVLIGMLRTVGVFDIQAPSQSQLALKSNSILDLYFELFVKEVERLLHLGLVKKYRKTEGNLKALKGKLLFAKHIQKNIVHQQHFYTQHTTYDKDHNLHRILYKALLLLKQININSTLQSRIGSLLLDFPEMPNIQISEAVFEKLKYDRKTEPYRNSIQIARLLLLNYHPDLSKGSNNVLALMFDMNLLWEKFVYQSIRKHKPATTTVKEQTSKKFWLSSNGNCSSMKPDIVINQGEPNCLVLDTKWKNIEGKNPSPEDLRQMYVYMKFFKAEKVALVYPGDENLYQSGKYFKEENQDIGFSECCLISLSVEKVIAVWQKNISSSIENWAKNKTS